MTKLEKILIIIFMAAMGLLTGYFVGSLFIWKSY